MINHHGVRTLSQVLVFLLLGICAAALLLLPGCGGQQPLALPPRISGEIAPDYRLEPARGVALARVVVITQGEPGFGPFTNPLYVQLHRGEGHGGAGERAPGGVTFPPPGAYVFGPESKRPSLWRYQPPGLMAVSVPGGTYDGLAIAYPDDAHATTTPSSIPVPSADFLFAAVEIGGEEIVYLGDIEIRQTYGAWDAFADQVNVAYSAIDNYDRTVADFRARFPRFGTTEIKRRVVRPSAE